MRGVTAVALAALLAAVFLGLVAVMVIQEGPRWRSGAKDPYEYILSDATQWVWNRLDHTLRADISIDDVLRILEWQVFYLQESVKGVPRGEAAVVVGDTPAATEYIITRSAAQGATYDPDLVAEVLERQTEYLVSIGAVAEPVGDPCCLLDVDGAVQP